MENAPRVCLCCNRFRYFIFLSLNKIVSATYTTLDIEIYNACSFFFHLSKVLNIKTGQVFALELVSLVR